MITQLILKALTAKKIVRVFLLLFVLSGNALSQSILVENTMNNNKFNYGTTSRVIPSVVEGVRGATADGSTSLTMTHQNFASPLTPLPWRGEQSRKTPFQVISS